MRFSKRVFAFALTGLAALHFAGRFVCGDNPPATQSTTTTQPSDPGPVAKDEAPPEPVNSPNPSNTSPAPQPGKGTTILQIPN